MTIETPLATRPQQRPTMFAQSSPSVFHDYATSPSNQDHSLHMDMRFTSSPNSVTMYDGEFMAGSLGSVCSDTSFVDTGQVEDFDLKPQYECSDDNLLNLNVDMTTCDDINNGVRGDVVWSPNDAGGMKMEDVFQVDQKDAIQGPTLAELNFDDSVYDDIESIIQKEEQERKLATGGCALWQQAHQSAIDINFSVPHVITGGQKPPIKFTTCTITSPTSSAMDVTVGSIKPATSVTSGLFPTTTKPFIEAPCIKTEPIDTQMAPKCLKMAQHSGLGLMAPMTSPVPIPAKSQSLCPLPMNIESEVVKPSSLQRLLTDPMPIAAVKREPEESTSFSFPATKPSILHRAYKRALSPGADGDLMRSMEQKWEEIKQFIHDEEQSLAVAAKEESEKQELILQAQQQQQQQKQEQLQQQKAQMQPSQRSSPANIVLPVPATVIEPLKSPKRIKVEPKDPAFTPKDDIESGDEDPDSEPEDSDDADSVTARDDDQLSDDESDQFSILDDNGASTSKGPPRYFWMYNTQSKGPKGKRLCKAVNAVDPYTLADFEDPVFDPVLNQTQYKHNGKARRGDGNDITPSPAKLYALGNELKKLNRTINDLTPVSELPAGARTKSRKEKNKLASRACRLKKKAQHEANKVKLYGLEREHHDLLLVLEYIRKDVFKCVGEGGTSDELLIPKLERLMKSHLKHMIAGHTADYVNSILAKVMSGDQSGGLSN